jgi:dCMP deaminase
MSESVSQRNWDMRFLDQAKLVASWSKDPSTKVGAVIVDENHRVVSQGFNGFARGVTDSKTRLRTRDVKYRLVIHAECNAILFAQRQLAGCTMYSWPLQPCAQCASMLIQVGIPRVVSVPPAADKLDRWGKDMNLAREIIEEGGASLLLI